jgi:hypothetical protein
MREQLSQFRADRRAESGASVGPDAGTKGAVVPLSDIIKAEMINLTDPALCSPLAIGSQTLQHN